MSSYPFENKPHIARGDSPMFMPVWVPAGEKWEKYKFNDWVCMDKQGFFGRDVDMCESYKKYKRTPRHHADSY